MREVRSNDDAWLAGSGEMVRRVRAFDWNPTGLGPIETWSSDLRSAASNVLNSAFPAALVWGPRLVTIHNDAFRPMLGEKPEALGQPFSEIWREAWREIGPLVERAYAGQATFIEDHPLEIDRYGRAETAYFTFSYSPVLAADGAVLGMIDTVLETTRSVLDRERLQDSEARFRAFVSASSDVVYRMNADWTEMRQLEGRAILRDTDAPSRAWLERYIHPDDRAEVRRAIDRAIQDKSMFELEHRVRRADDSLGWVLSRAAPVLTADGEIKEWLGAASDVTKARELSDARKQMEKALRESEERLRLVLETEAVAVLFFTPDGVLTDANDVFLRMTGYSRETVEAGRLTWREMTPPEHHVESQARLDQYAVTGRMGPYEKEYLREDGSRAWMLFAGRDLGNGLIVEIGVDIDDRKRAEATLHASEDRLQKFGEASQDVLWIRSAETFQWEYLTPAFDTVYGLDRAAALRGDNMAGWVELIVPEDRAHAIESLRRVHDGQWVTFEYRIRRPRDGQIRWLRDTDFPIADADGRVAHIGGVGHDVTALKETEERLSRSEERLRLAQDAAHVGMWDWNIVTNEVSWSDEHFRLLGYAIGEVEPGYDAWFARIHLDDRAFVEEALLKARNEHAPYRAQFRSIHLDGSEVWLSASGTFFYDAQGTPIRMIGVMQDITEQRRWQEHQRVLVGELQHRTRNLLGVVRSMADKTALASADLPDFRARFRDRLDALARVQGLLSRLDERDRVTFDELIQTELSAMNGAAEHVTLHGAEGIRLRSSTVQTLAMALHELATNAVKYGALKQPEGRLAISWSIEQNPRDDRPWLHIDWRESGVKMPPAGAAPLGGGQGRELIERALPYQLSARTRYIFGPEGVHCTISLPVSASRSESNPDHD